MNNHLLQVVGEKSEQFLPWLVLLLLLSYTYMELFHAPYLGFDFNPSNGVIQETFRDSPLLRAGDRLYKIDELLFADWADSLRLPLIDAVQPGDQVTIQIYRDNQLQTINWTITPAAWAEIMARLINIWPLGYLFWLAGLATFLSLRPRNTLRRIFIAFFFLTAIWLVAGNSSRRHLWEASVVFRMAIWLSVPVYLHLHWSFPRNLRSLPGWVFPLLYLAGAGLALLQWFELLPKPTYAIGFVVALLGSLTFLLFHFVRRADERRRTAVILYSFLFALLPSAVLSIASVLQSAPRLGGIALLTLPLLPASYFYAISRHQTGAVEIRANRLISLYLYLIVLGTGVVAFDTVWAVIRPFPGQNLVSTLVISLVVTLITLTVYPRFERWIETHFLGMPYAPATLLESYLQRITTSLGRAELIHLLRDVILPSLLIRQSALLLVRGPQREVLYAHGVPEDAVPPSWDIPDIGEMHRSHQLYPQEAATSSSAWVRLSLPLAFGERRLGVWLLGRHDPDDIYKESTLSLLENIARQTAMALVNIEQAEQLQTFYRVDIQRHEAERTRLARTLHDDILNQAANAYNRLETSTISADFEKEYELLKEQIRRMISDLRPAALHWGLRIALEELADELNDRPTGQPTFELVLPDSHTRYPDLCEEQIYRIVQQACENALRHSQASRVQIMGNLQQDAVDIRVIDDGIGFDAGNLELSRLLEQKHYGLIGMYERAQLIGAEMVVDSRIAHGTRVHLHWSGESTHNPIEDVS